MGKNRTIGSVPTFGQTRRNADAQKRFRDALIEWEGFGLDDPNSLRSQGVERPKIENFLAPETNKTELFNALEDTFTDPIEPTDEIQWASRAQSVLAYELSQERKLVPEAAQWRAMLNQAWRLSGKEEFDDHIPKIPLAITSQCIRALILVPRPAKIVEKEEK